MSESSARTPLACRRITPDDIPAAQRLSASIGWPHRREDWRFAIRTGVGFVVDAEDGADGTPGGADRADRSLLGSAMCWKFGEDQATLGMVIVAPGHRGQGIGRALMRRVLDELGEREITLYATQMAKPLFDATGFEACGTLDQIQGAAFRPPLVALPPGERLRPLGANDAAQLAALASHARGLDRAQVLSVLLDHADGIALDRDGELLGFSLFRRFGRGYLIGPVIAVDSPDPVRAKALIRHWLAQNEGALVRIDLPDDGGLRDWLMGLGLTRSETVVKMMRRGKAVAPTPQEDLPRDDAPLRQFAVITQSLT